MDDPKKLSHDLRNLLNLINNNAQVIDLYLKKDGPKEAMEFVSGIKDAVKDMDALITRALDDRGEDIKL